MRNLDTDAEMFFIQRAENKDDPWSGQIAFPGGNSDRRDQDIAATARRETDEEVGIRLPANALLARLDDQQGRSHDRDISLIISCLVFNLDPPQAVSHSPEVGDSFWIKVDDLLHPPALSASARQDVRAQQSHPGIQFRSGKVLWGLTYRFVKMFLEIIVRP
ncbi:NUDIX hydrolase [Candidatus Spongiihabitans sp.]|uniref:NUDIX hydrolase n=1 Tax=Candidatus Spongiihabitans sp. TaxID=3101308 RepID=UPI003C7E9F64